MSFPMIVASGSIVVIKYQFHSYLDNLTNDDIQKVKGSSRKYKITEQNQMIEGDDDKQYDPNSSSVNRYI